MSNQSKTVLRFAFIGFALAIVIGVGEATLNYDSVVVVPFAIISLILCPARLLFAFCIDCELTSIRGGIIMFSIIGVLNAGLYALITYAVLKVRART